VLATLFPDPKYRTEIREFVQAPTGEWEEFRVRTSDDERIPIEVTTVELPDRRRIVIGIDVSQKRKRELRLRWAGRLVHLGYWAFDVETEALTWSTETRRIFGWDADADVTYERYLEAVHPEDRDRVNAVHQDALDGETEHDIEYRILRPSGEERVLRERGALRRDRHGRPISVVGAALDITEAAQRRRELREAKEEAEQADRMKTALLSNMNHEFRTPLTAIISFAKLIRDTPDRAEDFADRILGGGRRLLRTLNAVMDFAEVEGDQFDPTPQVHALGAAVESVMNDFQEKADRKGLHLEVDIPDDPVRVEVDPHYVKRICTHLVSNAVKFTDEGMVRATVERRREGATITIQDTGIGIPDAFLPHVYDEFAQASSGYDRTHDGNGIGLTIVKRFVDRIGGSIDIESEKGEGTQVTVQIPGGGRREPSGET
jgi:PAS domain S-box-containing protein